MPSKPIIFAAVIVASVAIVSLLISSISYYKKVHKPKEVKKDDSLQLGRTFVECELGEKPEK